MAETGDKQESAVKEETSKVGIACVGIVVLVILGIFAVVLVGGGLR